MNLDFFQHMLFILGRLMNGCGGVVMPGTVLLDFEYEIEKILSYHIHT